MANFLIIGGSGFLGRKLLGAVPSRAVGTFSSHAYSGGIQFDIRRQSLSEISSALPQRATHVILTHGDSNVDHCRSNWPATYALNVARTIGLLQDIYRCGLTPVYVSTDYVFDGTRGLRKEEEPLSPTTAYGRQKAEVEEWLRTQSLPYLICRASKLVSGDRGSRSVLGEWVELVKSGATLRCATDQVFSPALVDDVARAIIELADRGRTGVFHVAGPEPISRYELARLFAKAAKRHHIEIRLESCNLSDIAFIEPRPLDTSLSVGKLRTEISFDYAKMRDVCESVCQEHFTN